MWDRISNVSSIVTCVSFILYLIGHIWVVLKNRNIIYEKFTVIPYDSSIDIEAMNNILLVDDKGCEFSLESEYGIDEIKIYKVKYDINKDGTLHFNNKELKKRFTKLHKEKLYIRCDLGETIPTTQIEIKRSDYARITFDLYESGRNGQIVTCNKKYRMSFISFLYHLCV